MKHYLSNSAISCTVAAVIAASGCASHKTDGYVSVTPADNVVVPDTANRADVDVTINVPGGYVSKRSRMVITPMLVAGDSVIDRYSEMALYSPIYRKKAERLLALEHQPDPFLASAVTPKSMAQEVDFRFAQQVQLPEGVETARLVAVVSSDGCGICTGIDTIPLAAFGTPTALIEMPEEIELALMSPEFQIRPKVIEGKGEARLQFIINKYDINLSLGNNRQELDSMLVKLSPVLSDSLATLNTLEIFGMASADGALPFNTTLSSNRAKSAKNWLSEQLHIPAKVQRIIKVGSRPEGWEPVLAAMKADHHPDTTKVEDILIRYADQNDDVAEKYIRRLACWNDIKERYLQKDRKVEYVYSYTIKSFTDDAEMLDMFGKRPDAFNEDEFLRVATLADTDDFRKEVYQTTLQYFPESEAAANNLAVIYFNEGHPDEALRLLEGRKELTPEMMNTLVASYVALGHDEKALALLDRTDLPALRYSLGLSKAQQHDYEEAYRLLRPFSDANVALVALALNKDREAAGIMAKVDGTAPLDQYVRAIIAARLGNDTEAFSLLREACADGKLRNRAFDEPDFLKYADDPRFRQALGK